MATTQVHVSHRPRGRRRAMGRGLPTLLIAAVLAMAGCGGSSKDGAGTSATVTPPNSGPTATPTAARVPSSANMVAAAEAICMRLNAALAAEHTTVPSLGAIAGAAAHRAAVEEAALSELAKLEPPTAIARAWRQMIAYRRTLASDLVELSQKAQRKEFNAFRPLSASTATAGHDLLVTGKRARFKYCSRVG
jgi:hypothetical protein